VIVSHRNKLIFLRTRKTGSTSLHLALSHLLDGEDIASRMTLPSDDEERIAFGAPDAINWRIPVRRWGLREWVRWSRGRSNEYNVHTTAATARRTLPRAVWRDYYKFTVERNPWDIAVSAYFWRSKRDQLTMTFGEFVQSPYLQEFSNWPIYTIRNRVVLDHIYRYDDGLDKALRDVALRASIPHLPPLPTAKSGLRPTNDYREMYDSVSRLRVAEVFHREIAHFGWSFD
jgi:hypothetical protein